VQARRLLADEFAEAENDAELVGLDAEREGIKARNGNTKRREQEKQRTRNARPRHNLLQAILTSPQKLLKIGLLAAAAAGRTLAPGTTAPAAFPTAATATLIAPRHYHALLGSLLGDKQMPDEKAPIKPRPASCCLYRSPQLIG
jgi:hypothetical protein